MVSDRHLGLKEAIDTVFIGATWQRCRVHFLRNSLAKVPRASAEMVAAGIRSIFAQPDLEHVRAQFFEATKMLRAQFPKWRPCSKRPEKTFWPPAVFLRLVTATRR